MISPEDNYRDHPQYLEYSRKEIRKVVFFQGLEAPENFLGNCPYEGEEASWWEEGKKFWYEQEEGAILEEHPYFYN
jgi:hypothetical protein